MATIQSSSKKSCSYISNISHFLREYMNITKVHKNKAVQSHLVMFLTYNALLVIRQDKIYSSQLFLVIINHICSMFL